MIGRFANRGAERLQATLDGRATPAGEASDLAALAAELRELGLNVPTAHSSLARREELRAAVALQAARQAGGAPARRFRGAVLGVAAIAGGGLVVASAASGANPATLVVDAAREFPRIAARESAPETIAIEGEVVAARDGGRTLEVRAGTATIVVEAPRAARDVTEAGTPVPSSAIAAGDTVRVTTDVREPSAPVVAAKKIEVLPPSSTGAAVPKNTPASALSSAAPTSPPAATAAPASPTPRPTATPTKPAPTSEPASSVSAGALEPVATPAPAKTPPAPTKTATPRPKTISPGNDAQPLTTDEAKIATVSR